MSEYDTSEAEQLWAKVRQPLPTDGATRFKAAEELLLVLHELAKKANYDTKIATTEKGSRVVRIEVSSSAKSAWVAAHTDGTFTVGTDVYPKTSSFVELEFDYAAGTFFVGTKRGSALSKLTRELHHVLALK